MGDDDDSVLDVGGFDVVDHGGHFVFDRDGGEVRRVAAPPREIDRQCRARQERQEAVPESSGRPAAVHEDVRHG